MSTSDEAHDAEAEARGLSGLRSQLGRVRETLEPRARELYERGADTARSAHEGARDRLDAGVASLTMAEWRDEVEAALSDITSVLLAMDARIAALERRLDE